MRNPISQIKPVKTFEKNIDIFISQAFWKNFSVANIMMDERRIWKK